ncbi:unnamed protein product [Rotaria sp. Silwood1]|nr:unnamed protein product [Rotaria sp. Silwood1]
MSIRRITVEKFSNVLILYIIWNLKLKYQISRTTVLSTLHLDEVDMLSDRLSIISSSELQGFGTTMYLKDKYGEDCNLIIELISISDENNLRRQQQKDSTNDALDPINIKLNIINSTTNSTLRFRQEHGDQITYVIIDDVEHTKIFSKMLADLDENRNRYPIKSYSLSNSSLEQAFFVSLLSKFIQQTFTQSPSLGTRCMTSTVLDTQLYSCDSTDIGYGQASISKDIMNALNNVDYNQTHISPKCNCWILKTEFLEEYLIKRFGGFKFLTENDLNSIDLLNETLINKLIDAITQTNQSTSMIDAAKIAALFRIWYNNKGWPAGITFANVFNNALLRGVLLQKNSSISIADYGITTICHPLPETPFEIDNNIQDIIIIELLTAICVIFALAFIPASFLVFLIDEHSTTSKHL